jgi:polar amino acid transport system ATP-binding protein
MTQSMALRAIRLIRSFGAVRALDEVYLEIPYGQVVSLVGPSGCGKSTLLRCLTYLDPPDDGFIQVGGDWIGRQLYPGGEIRRLSRRETDKVRPRIGLVFQALNLWPHLNVLENVVCGQLVALDRTRAHAEVKARSLLSRLLIEDLADAFPGQLSGGQKQRVAIARALAMDPEILLFDEPTSALDPELVGEVLTLLKEFACAGMTMLVVTHELGFALNVATRLLFMDEGKIIADGKPHEIMNSTSNSRVADFFSRISAFHPDFEPPKQKTDIKA